MDNFYVPLKEEGFFQFFVEKWKAQVGMANHFKHVHKLRSFRLGRSDFEDGMCCLISHKKLQIYLYFLDAQAYFAKILRGMALLMSYSQQHRLQSG